MVASKFRPMVGSAIPTTVASIMAMPEPSTVAAMTHRPLADVYASTAEESTDAEPKVGRLSACPWSAIAEVVSPRPLRRPRRGWIWRARRRSRRLLRSPAR